MTWGPIAPVNAEACTRLTDRLFDVHVDLSPDSYHWVTGLGEPPPPREPPQNEPLYLSGIRGAVIQLIERDPQDDVQFAGATFRVELEAPMPIVAFAQDPLLNPPGGVSFEQALRLARPGGVVLINWITEDEESFCFNELSFGMGGTRVSKGDGSVSLVATSMPIPGYVPRDQGHYGAAASYPNVILYRPVGVGELRLIARAKFRVFPPRLPDQPIFIPFSRSSTLGASREIGIRGTRSRALPASSHGSRSMRSRPSATRCS